MQNKTTTNQEEELMLAEVQRREEEAQKLYDALSSVEKEQIQKVIDLGREYLQRGQSKPNENRSEQLVEKIFEPIDEICLPFYFIIG